MKKQFFINLIISLSFLCLFSTQIKAQKYAKLNDIPAGYYDGTAGLTGEVLKHELHLIIKGHTRRSYSQVREDLKITDEDPNNSSNVILLYKGISSPKSNFGGNPDNWNREHVWPKSHGFPNESDTAYTDIHHLRPTDASVNADRGNLDFDNGGIENPEAPGNFSDNDSWEPRDAVKGDIARMVLYMSVRYEEDGNYDLEPVDFAGSSGSHLGVLSTLIQWHTQDPVDSWEVSRHEKIFAIQGNRNPFVDHPEFVYEIWGGTPPGVSPTSGIVFISEVSDALSSANEYIEFYNNSNDFISLANSKLIRLNNSGGLDGYVFDFFSEGSGDTSIPPNGILVVSRGANKTDFETEWGSLPTGAYFNSGNSLLYFGSGTARRWALMDGGTANTNDGNLIDDTGQSIAGSGKRSYQEPVGIWSTDNNINNSTPGTLDTGQILPVELVSFNAQYNSGLIYLVWKTATEINNYGFEILRKSSISDWRKIGFKNGSGFSSIPTNYAFTDNSILRSGTYFYRLKQIDINGDFTFSDIINVSVPVPQDLQLEQNYPNPFNPTTKIKYRIPSGIDHNLLQVQLKVFSVLGSEVAVLVNERKPAGEYEVEFNSAGLASGIYFYKLTAGSSVKTKKMIVLQ